MILQREITNFENFRNLENFKTAIDLKCITVSLSLIVKQQTWHYTIYYSVIFLCFDHRLCMHSYM